MKTIVALLGLVIMAPSLWAQHHEDNHPTPTHGESYFRVSAALGHTYLPEHTVDGKKSLALPTFGLDVEYWFNTDFGIGLHNDLELLNFEVEDEEGVQIEREFPVLLTLDALWKPVGGLVLFAGPGIEFEPSENYFVLRIGAEYEIHFAQHWDVAPMAFYDARNGAYNTLSIGLGIGYSFSGH